MVSTTVSPSVPSQPVTDGRKRTRLLSPLITGQEWVLAGLLVVLWALLGIFTPAFLTSGSIVPLLAGVAPIALIGVGMTFVMITGGIDVSVGGMVMLSAVVGAKLLVNAQLSAPVVLLAVAALGLLMGGLNGVLVAYGNIHPIIVTFGTANLFQFLALRTFNSSTVSGIPPAFAIFGKGASGQLWGIPISFAVSCLVAVIATYYLRHSRSGRHLYSIGGNENAAVRAGIRVGPLKVFSYALVGLLSGIASTFVIAQGTSTLEPSVGQGMELLVIAAVVIGGTSVLGGKGTVIGTVLGAVLVQTVRSGITQLGWPSQAADLFVGVAIVLAVGIDIIRDRKRSAR